jgi:hypothetical protein
MATASTSAKQGSPDNTDKGTVDKFDLSKVKIDELPEEMRETVKGFQADYTKKTQAIKEKEKTIEGQEEQIETGKKWGEWYSRNQNTLAQYNEYAKNLTKDGNVHIDNQPKVKIDNDDDDDNDMFSDDSKKVRKELKTDINTVRDEVKQQNSDTTKSLNAGMNMMVSLMKVVQDNEYDFKIDPEKVIQHAREEGIADMNKAVNSAYYNEIRDSEIKKGIEDGVAKEKEKLNLDVVTDNMPRGRTVIRTTKDKDKK